MQNERNRTRCGKWTVVGLLWLTFYVLASGPAAWADTHGWGGARVLFTPLRYMADHSPAMGRWYDRYLYRWEHNFAAPPADWPRD